MWSITSDNPYPDRAAIEAVLPQRGRWLVVKSVNVLDQSMIEITPEIPDDCAAGHFGIIPGVVLEEAANQALALFTYAQFRQLQLAGLPALQTSTWRFLRPIPAHERVVITVKLTWIQHTDRGVDVEAVGEAYKFRPNGRRVIAATGSITGTLFRLQRLVPDG